VERSRVRHIVNVQRPLATLSEQCRKPPKRAELSKLLAQAFGRHCEGIENSSRDDTWLISGKGISEFREGPSQNNDEKGSRVELGRISESSA
jgi:hypothetical protein